MKKTLRALSLIVAAAIILCCFAGCGEKKESEKIVFGTNAEFPPFEFISSVNNGTIGEFDGIDINIAKIIGEKIGKTAEISNIEFDSLLIALNNGQIDAAIAGMTITEERKQSVDFSIPYYTATQVMIVKEGSDIQTAADMQGKKIAVVQGYTGETCVQNLGFEYEAFKKGTECILELVNGKCDVVVIDSATAEKFIGDNPGLIIIEDNTQFEKEEYGIAVAKGNTELLDSINTVLQQIIDDGTLADLAVKYIDEM